MLVETIGAIQGLVETPGAVGGLLWLVLGQVQRFFSSRVVEGLLGDEPNLLGDVEGLMGAVGVFLGAMEVLRGVVEGFYRYSRGLTKVVKKLERFPALIRGLKVHSRRSVEDFILICFLLHLLLPCISLLTVFLLLPSPPFCEGLQRYHLILRPGSFCRHIINYLLIQWLLLILIRFLLLLHDSLLPLILLKYKCLRWMIAVECSEAWR